MRSARRFAVLLAGLAAGCIYPPPLPLAMAPADAVVLAEPKSDKTLAVLDFADERPEFERSKLQRQLLEAGGRVVPFAPLELAEGSLEQRFIGRIIPQLETAPAADGSQRQGEERESPVKTMHIEVGTRQEVDGSTPA